MSKLDDVLLSELVEVHLSSKFFLNALENHNYLPEDFPNYQIKLLLKSVSGLAEGSLEGARLPLEHASVRLSEVRRRFFCHPKTDANSEYETEFELPMLERGDSLDISLSALLSSISTALDAYREQARSELESTNTPEFLEVLPSIDSAFSDHTAVDTQIDSLDELQRHASNDENSDDMTIELVAMSAADARNSLASAEAEISSKYIIRGWVRKLANLSADTLLILRKAIDGLSIASGVAYEFYSKYKSSIKNIRDVVISEAQDWLKFISAQLQRAESKLRDDSQSKGENAYGIVRAMASQKFIVTADDIPYAIAPSELNIPQVGSVVEFVKEYNDEKILAKAIRDSKTHLIIDGKLLSKDKSLKPVINIIRKSINDSKRNVISVRNIEKRVISSGLLPANFWSVLGYNSFEEFLSLSKNFYCHPPKSPEYISNSDFVIRDTSLEEVQQWLFSKISEQNKPWEIGKLAMMASEYFSAGTVPVRIQVGGIKFSDILKQDDRFIVEKGKVSLRVN